MGNQARRSSILTAAARLFGHYGPRKTSVADIAREAAVGVGTVYLEFRSKDAILAALSEAHHRRVLGAVERAWGPGRPVAERLAAALDARFEAFLDFSREGAHAAELFRCHHCEAIERAHRAYREEERRLFARFLQQGDATGELAVDDAEATAVVLLSAYAAFAPPLLDATPTAQLRQRLPRMHRLVLRGLLRP